MKKKILLYSSSRADIDRYVPIIKKICKEKIFQPVLFLSSFHKQKNFGNYLYEIKKLKIKVLKNKLNNDLHDTYESKIDHYCYDVKNFNESIIKVKPIMIILLGDRFEIFSAAIPAVLQDIPIVHFYGGAVTEGAIDEKIRHAVTKLSNIHLLANKKYNDRVLQLGEEVWRTKLVGLDFLDELKNQKILPRNDFFSKFGLSSKLKTFFATFHPVTLEKENLKFQIKNFLLAIEKSKFQCIFTYPNSDLGYETILREIEKFIRKKGSIKHILLRKLNINDYSNVLKNCDVVIGNSSMGIVDAASFKKPVINIGNRQKGKFFPKNVVNSNYHYKSILRSLKHINLKKYNKKLSNLKNPYEPKKYNLSKFLNNLLVSKGKNINKKIFVER